MKHNPKITLQFGLLINSRISNAPREFEEVRGLDDLFPTHTIRTSSEEPRHLSLVDDTAQPPIKQTSLNDSFQLDQELETNLNSCDYMVRNNRILSNSIASLSEAYFKKAYQEEAAQEL